MGHRYWNRVDGRFDGSTLGLDPGSVQASRDPICNEYHQYHRKTDEDCRLDSLEGPEPTGRLVVLDHGPSAVCNLLAAVHPPGRRRNRGRVSDKWTHVVGSGKLCQTNTHDHESDKSHRHRLEGPDAPPSRRPPQVRGRRPSKRRSEAPVGRTDSSDSDASLQR